MYLDGEHRPVAALVSPLEPVPAPDIEVRQSLGDVVLVDTTVDRPDAPADEFVFLVAKHLTEAVVRLEYDPVRIENIDHVGRPLEEHLEPSNIASASKTSEACAPTSSARE